MTRAEAVAAIRWVHRRLGPPSTWPKAREKGGSGCIVEMAGVIAAADIPTRDWCAIVSAYDARDPIALAAAVASLGKD